MEILEKKPRKKYRFKTRDDAEQAEQRANEQLSRLAQALNGVVNGEVQWLPENYGTETSWYRFGILKMRWSVIVLVSFHHTGQRTHTAAYGEDWPQEQIGYYRVVDPKDTERLSYRTGLYELRRVVNDAIQE